LLLRALKAAADIVKDGAALPQSIEPERLWSRQVFVVHGHDESATNALESFLTEIGLAPIVLHRQPD
jgi:predicted nucleotide-binding protein